MMTDDYPVGTTASAPHWHATKTEHGWMGWPNIVLRDWTPPEYATIVLPAGGMRYDA